MVKRRMNVMNKRVYRRSKRNILKLGILFSIFFIATSVFLSFFIGTSSVLESVENFNSSHHVEGGAFQSASPLVSDNKDIEEMEFAEYKANDYTIRIFPPRSNINKYQVTSGSDLKNSNEILLDKNFLEANNLHLGDEIEVYDETLTIVGTAISPDYITTKNSEMVLQANSKKFGVGFVSREKFDEIFESSFSYYSYSSNLSIDEIITEYQPVSIKDSENNSRIQQVLGDAKAPRDLAILVTLIMFFIALMLSIVYHYEISKSESNNIKILSFLGYKRWRIFIHYAKETNFVAIFAWASGVVVGLLGVPIIMEMNGDIYNYPIMNIDRRLLVLSVILSFILVMLINNFVALKLYLPKQKKQKRQRSLFPNFLKKKINISFVFKYRLLKFLRKKREMLIFTLLIFVVGFLVNFSFLLKVSVEQYIEDIDNETSFSQMYFLGETPLPSLEKGDETVKLLNLYDNNGISQSVYVVPEGSLYFPLEGDEIVITRAFSEKYNVSTGDIITLEDIISGHEYQIKIESVNNVKTVSSIYISEHKFEALFDKSTPFTEVLVSSNQHPSLEETTTCLSKEDILQSGENILKVINKQITLIIFIAIFVEVTLLYSLLEFIYRNSERSIAILGLNGFSTKEITKMHLGLNGIVAFLVIILSYFLASIYVRLFFDKIMFNFVNYVAVTDNFVLILITNLMVLVVYMFF